MAEYGFLPLAVFGCMIAIFILILIVDCTKNNQLYENADNRITMKIAIHRYVLFGW